ncbi:MAG TPA: ACP S-malonyltransferase [Candidatus Baltobacteraceae bacterium]|nr:ACP S-malonyltransferase [Candidatus Baltobacteraceae bacterium]
MSKRTGVIFPGQGSQVVGMGVDVARRSSAASDIFSRAAKVLGYDLLALQRNGPEETLRETQYSQPAIFTTNLALYYASEPSLVAPVVTAGHSFGEFCSLTISNALTFEEALRVVDERGKAMQYAAERAPGGMSAVIGVDAEIIRQAVAGVRERTGARVQLANFNSPSQIVISGDIAAVAQAGDALLEAGAKRVVPLNVSGAWHSELMEPAVEHFAAAVRAAHFRMPQIDVISNVDAQPYRDVEAIKRNLVSSITNEVRWHETAQRLLSYELDLVIEFGASPVLGPLMKRLAGTMPVLNVADYAAIEKLRSTLSGHDAQTVEGRT